MNNDNIQVEDSPQTYSEDGDDDEDADELLEEEEKQTNAVSSQEGDSSRFHFFNL